MARYKPVDRHLSKLLAVNFSEQIVPGSFEYAVHWLVDHKIDMSVFDARYRNDDTGATAFDPAVLLKIVLLGYARRLGIVEPVFGNLYTHGLTRFTLRSRGKVDAQLKLYYLTHNIQKLIPHAA